MATRSLLEHRSVTDLQIVAITLLGRCTPKYSRVAVTINNTVSVAIVTLIDPVKL